jgi:hypothetical protein
MFEPLSWLLSGLRAVEERVLAEERELDPRDELRGLLELVSVAIVGISLCPLRGGATAVPLPVAAW